MSNTVALCACLTLFFGLTQAASCQSQFDDSPSQPVYAPNGMVAGPEPEAVRAGVEILEEGGNAFDAAAAVGFALSVTQFTAGSLGGGGFATALNSEGTPIFLDFRVTVPLEATNAMFLDDEGERDRKLETTLLACSVPGTVHGLLQLQQDYGVLSRAQVLKPAIRLARDGVEISHYISAKFSGETEKLMHYPATEAIFFTDGHAPTPGSLLRQPELARALQRIAEDGISGFYEGETADIFVDFMAKGGGIIGYQDLKDYRSVYRQPITSQFKGFTVITTNLPSAGGVVLTQILKLLEPFDLVKMGFQTPQYIHTVVEAERLAYADRSQYLDDPDFIGDSIEQLLSDEYIEKRRAIMPKGQAGKSTGETHGVLESKNTTSFSVADKDNNIVSITYTLRSNFGLGAVAEGIGFFLNNQMINMGDKVVEGIAHSGGANDIKPGKRKISSMSPTILTKNGKFFATFGSPGGQTIITTNLQVLLNLVVWEMNIRDAIDAGRFHHQWMPDVITYEYGQFSDDKITSLKNLGYRMEVDDDGIGHAAGIQRSIDESLMGHDDSRHSGLALGH